MCALPALGRESGPNTSFSSPLQMVLSTLKSPWSPCPPDSRRHLQGLQVLLWSPPHLSEDRCESTTGRPFSNKMFPAGLTWVLSLPSHSLALRGGTVPPAIPQRWPAPHWRTWAAVSGHINCSVFESEQKLQHVCVGVPPSIVLSQVDEC